MNLLTLSMAAPLSYRLLWETPPRYTYIIEIEAEPSPGSYTDFALPAWRPGRYILQNFAAAVSHFHAQDEQGRPLTWRKVHKDTWRVLNPTRSKIRVRYHFYAHQIDAGSSYLAEDLVYFNPVNLFMYIPGRLDAACILELPRLPKTWSVATALPRRGERWEAQSYHHLADSPFLAAPSLRSEKATCAGITFYVHFWGKVEAKSLQGFTDALCRIIQVQKEIWGGKLPLKEYHFLYLLVPFPLRHAVEHEYSAMFVLPEEGAASEEALRSFLGISAHEFFHVWNVKRLRPAALWPYRYDQEVYTGLHWLTEGFTDYYTGISLLRAGLMPYEEYWKKLSAELSTIENTIAYTLFSPEELSIDSWHATSVYRPVHFQGSFYAAGKRVAFLLDMQLRRRSGGKITLDSLMRYLYERYYEKGEGMPEDAVEKAAIQLGGPEMREFFARYVYGREVPDYKELLQELPIQVAVKKQPWEGWGQVGIVRWRAEGEGIRVEEVLPGSAADEAGIGPGDFLLLVEGTPARNIPTDFWQSHRQATLTWNSSGLTREGQVLLPSKPSAWRMEITLLPTEPTFLLK
ncbi:MAG: PDZ domain-containing protein [Bacteroidia bacterium]|nr:PDZ domain-containing protein [Bacteroidia bacterium]MDW8417619.1 PDZ domain-containing protein [Bacteroidia bacterium]